MKIKLLLLLLFLPLTSAAQEKCAVYNYGKFTKGQAVFLFADRVNIRSAPDTAKKNIIANLPIGHKLKIEEVIKESYMMNGFKSNWYKVSFSNKGTPQTGYIWGGLLSITSTLIKEKGSKILFLAGITKFSGNSGLKAEMRVISNSTIMSRTQFSPMQFDTRDGAYNYSVSGTIGGNRGLHGVKNIITLSFLYEACGYPNGDIIFIFDGKKIFAGTESQSVAEAGVFHFSTKLVFPDDPGGQKNALIKIQTTENFDEDKKDYVVDKIEKSKFTWNGMKFIKSK